MQRTPKLASLKTPRPGWTNIVVVVTPANSASRLEVAYSGVYFSMDSLPSKVTEQCDTSGYMYLQTSPDEAVCVREADIRSQDFMGQMPSWALPEPNPEDLIWFDPESLARTMAHV